jgi:hypothetical protein
LAALAAKALDEMSAAVVLDTAGRSPRQGGVGQ